ncbi:MAG: tRNA lysidine(34) synthetase TilS [Candidatus Margulisiibacteriota bacterium]
MSPLHPKVRFESLSSTDAVLVAFSGGPDSTFLLHQVATFFTGTKRAVYFDHGLRAPEVLAAEKAIVTACAQALDVVLVQQSLPIQQTAAETGMSVEEAGHHLRRKALKTLAKSQGIAHVLTGHHRDDHIETLLLQWIRGTGSGWAGITPASDLGDGLTLHRPLLGLRKAEILGFLAKQKMGFVTDTTNLEPTFLRNKIRHQVLPLLSSINPTFEETLLKAAATAQEKAQYWEEQAAPILARFMTCETGFSVPFALLKPLPKPILSHVLWRFLSQAQQRAELGAEQVVSAGHIDTLMQLIQTDQSIGLDLPGLWRVVLKADYLWLEKTTYRRRRALR